MLKKVMFKVLLALIIFCHIIVTIYGGVSVQTIQADKRDFNRKIKFDDVKNTIQTGYSLATNPVGTILGGAMKYWQKKKAKKTQEEINRLIEEMRRRMRMLALQQRLDSMPKLEIEKMRKEPSIPILFADMKAIVWENGVEKVLENPQTNPEKWYDYYAGRMANAKTKDGSYWVWIPRFAYRITYYTDSSQQVIKGYYTDKGFVLPDMKTLAEESLVKTPYLKTEKEFVPNYETIKSKGFRIHEAFRKRWYK